MNLKYNKQLIKFLVFLHILFFISWIGLFFVPESIWPNRVFYHFWYVIGVMGLNVGWGSSIKLYNKRGNLFVCPLTTMTQYARGHKISDEKNNGHSFVSEILLNLNIRYPRLIILMGGTLSVLIISYQYFL